MTTLFPRPYLIVDNTRPLNVLFDPNTLIGMAYLNALVPPPESDFENWEQIMADLKAEASK
jgi:hypothetical protein